MYSTLSAFLFTFLLLIELNHPQVGVNACTCLAPEVPQYCTADFFVLAQILGKTENESKSQLRYRFKPLKVLSDPKSLLSVGRVKLFTTSSASSACGVELEVGTTYLIAGAHNPANNRLRLDLCRSYVEPYTAPTWTAGQFNHLLENCAKINAIDK